MFKTCAANTIGIDAVALVACVAMVEDAKHYSGAVSFHNGQLQPLLGIRKWERLDGARRRAVEAGWLRYIAPASGVRAPGVYWSMIPTNLEDLEDGPVDEDIDPVLLAYQEGYRDGKAGHPPKAYTENGYAPPKASPENGYGAGYGSGYAPGYGLGEPSSLSLSLSLSSCPNRDGSDGQLVETPQARGPRKPAYTPEDLETAKAIWEDIRAMQPDRKPPSLDKWANDVRLMRERDGRTHQEILALFRKANRDEFWRLNILSPAKLREQWDRLTLKLNGAARPVETVASLYPELK
jgi:hypothetical protein